MLLIILAFTTLYLLLVSLLRTRHLGSLSRKYAHYTPNPYKMTYKEAHPILLSILRSEFPFSYAVSTQFALLKSYAIPSGTKLLVATRRLTSLRTVAKRSEDTAIFITELLASGLDTERGLSALSKMNWIHRQYGERISNADMIHTFALFVLEPLRWIDRFEWRPLSQVERVAVFVYWREIALRMGMEGLPRTLDELGVWAEEYERTHMYFAESNKACVEATLGLYVRFLPARWQRFGRWVGAALIEPRVRPLVGVPEPPALVVALVEGVLDLRAWVVRVLLLPRRRGVDASGEVDAKTGRVRRGLYLFEPWYVGETVLNRVVRFLGMGMGRPLPGPEYLSEGYLPEELGPKEFREKAREDVRAEAARMREYARQGGGNILGCPFAFR
ncbi:hypothetical protein BJY01DRAFT_263833 [Aspergillus pseudoustus]|uniref:ER-bound oxygenase mpaB/mpaB'/Rubber oxygenase catalytic domain-containing protein n=1 Tax=Aspergillus pseudoustus TaxID=1810923 RepID=A0ABR4JXJ3_9EURO